MKNSYKYFVVFFAGVVNGLLGTGGGTLLLPFLYKYLDDEKDAHRAVIMFILPLSIVSASVYTVQTKNYLTFSICVGACIGGIIGYKLSKKVSLTMLKLVFGLIIIFSGVRILL